MRALSGRPVDGDVATVLLQLLRTVAGKIRVPSIYSKCVQNSSQKRTLGLRVNLLNHAYSIKFALETAQDHQPRLRLCRAIQIKQRLGQIKPTPFKINVIKILLVLEPLLVAHFVLHDVETGSRGQSLACHWPFYLLPLPPPGRKMEKRIDVPLLNNASRWSVVIPPSHNSRADAETCGVELRIANLCVAISHSCWTWQYSCTWRPLASRPRGVMRPTVNHKGCNSKNVTESLNFWPHIGVVMESPKLESQIVRVIFFLERFDGQAEFRRLHHQGVAREWETQWHFCCCTLHCTTIRSSNACRVCLAGFPCSAHAFSSGNVGEESQFPNCSKL